MLGSAQLMRRRFRLSTIGDGGTSASRSRFSIKAVHIDQPREATTSSREPAQLSK
jgi:hypothetical protein